MSELDDHIKGIRGWLEKQGYPLEMSVARSLFLSGLGIVQGSNYEDPDTNQAREIDILSRSYAYNVHALLLQGIIECKYSSQPLVAFTYGGDLEKSPIDFWAPCNNAGRIVLNQLIQDKIANTIPAFAPRNTIAYSIKQANSKDEGQKNSIFEAVMSVVKASYFLSNLYETKAKYTPSQDKQSSQLVAFIGLPIIIVRAPLFICYLDHKHEIAVEPRASVLLEWTYPKVGTMMINIIQEREVVNLASDLAKSITMFDTQLKRYF